MRRPSKAVAGRYMLLDQLGAGATGTVWRAWDLREHHHVAAKLLTRDGVAPDPVSDPLLLRFVREQSLRVAHPHVLTPTGWAAEDDRVVFTMQLVRGGTLGDLLAEHGPLPSDYVAVLLEQLLDALVGVHAAGIVHRDVKPANLLLEPTGTGRPHLWLCDFGVAAPLAPDVRLTRVSSGVGTDGYIPPEAQAGAPPAVRHDLYAAGVVALLALTGRRSGEPHGPLAPLVGALTSPDPDRRPVTATAALDLLRRVGVPVGTPWRAARRVPCVPERVPGHCGTSARLPWARVATGCLVAAAACDVVAVGLVLW
ncbi:MAG: serine/threonine protein kinase [Nocardioides sp.]|nr:serine/threonine protein kinase [Nocardioides sp.]